METKWLYVSMALLAGFAGGIVGGRLSAAPPAVAADHAQKTLSAQEFQLLDGSGRRQAALTTSKDGSAFEMYDDTGKMRVRLGVTNQQGVGLVLYDKKGTMRASMLINDEDIPAVRLFDSEARMRELMGVDQQGEPALDFYSQQARLLRELP
jgi:hypothetical protein